MKPITSPITLASIASLLIACGPQNEAQLAQQEDTDTFRQALPTADDVALEYGAGSRSQALNGDYALLAGLTAEAVVGTNAFMLGHFLMLEAVSNHEPTESGENFRVWEGTRHDLTLRIRADRSETPRGFRYDYTLAGKVTDSDADFLDVITGHVVRLDDESDTRSGFGIVRFHFGNLNALEPERQIAGTVRVAFGKADRAHAVRVRAIGVKTPDDPYFPPAAAYRYGVTQEGAGGLQWFAHGDVKKDGEPFENVAVHTVWRENKSGIGSGFVTGGSLEVDYWHLLECWDPTFIKGFDMLSVPGLDLPSGDPATCFASPGELEVPEMDEAMADEDPEVPADVEAEAQAVVSGE